MNSQWNELPQDSHASAAELREFLGQMKHRSPQEVLGMLTASQLLNCTLLAAAGFAVLMIVLTVVPFALRGPAAPPVASQEAAAAPTVDDAQPTTQPAATAPADSAPGAKSVAERAVDAMGIGETKPADPNQNPLESSLDDLLDGIE